MLPLKKVSHSRPSGLPAVSPFYQRETERQIDMWYGNTKSLLESALRQLNTGESQPDAEWQVQTEIVETCLAEMSEMSEPTINSPKGVNSRYIHRPAADKLNRAMPHVKAMLAAMRARDRASALKHGAEAFRRL